MKVFIEITLILLCVTTTFAQQKNLHNALTKNYQTAENNGLQNSESLPLSKRVLPHPIHLSALKYGDVPEHHDYSNSDNVHHKSKYPKKHSISHGQTQHKHSGEQNHEHVGGEKKRAGINVHHTEIGNKGHEGKEQKSSKYQEHLGKKSNKYESAKKSGEVHQSHGGEHTFQHNDGHKAKKNNLFKGYREQYHKNEEKKHDSFYSNREKSGEYKKFDIFNSKKSHHHQDKTDGGKYKSGKFSDKHGKEGKYGKGHADSNHKHHQGEQGNNSYHTKHTKWAKKNQEHHDY